MKKIIAIFIAILSINSAQGVISWSVFSIINQNSNNYQFKIVSHFPFGSGILCPIIYPTPTILSADTIYIKELYNTSGIWPTNFCVKTDTVYYTNIYPAAHYINISTGYYYEQLANPGVYDTVWSVHDSTFLITPLSTFQNSPSNKGFKIYPNPNHGEFAIELDPEADYHQMEIRDATGRLLFSEEVHGNRTSHHLPELSPGYYILQIENKKQTKRFQQKLVIN